MLDFLPDHPAYQYPDLVNVVYVLGWAFFLASLIAITHRVTFLGDQYPVQFFQALVLGSLVTAMVMMAIGDSLARGLGVFGAMAIIRFRTRIDDPRNVLFLFAALSSGLAVGVYGFNVSFAGTLIFCVGAFILHVSPFRYHAHGHVLELRFSEDVNTLEIEEAIRKHCHEFRLIGTTRSGQEKRLEYSLSLKGSKERLVEDLAASGKASRVQVRPMDSSVIG